MADFYPSSVDNFKAFNPLLKSSCLRYKSSEAHHFAVRNVRKRNKFLIMSGSIQHSESQDPSKTSTVWPSRKDSTLGTKGNSYHNNEPVSTFYHTAGKVETLTLIVRKYEASVKEISLGKQNKNANFTRKGQTFFVPVDRKDSQKPVGEEPSLEHVQGDDTSFKVASTSMPAMPLLPPSDLFSLKIVKNSVLLYTLVPSVIFCLWLLVRGTFGKVDIGKQTPDSGLAVQEPRFKRWQGILDSEMEGEILGKDSSQSSKLVRRLDIFFLLAEFCPLVPIDNTW
eukprot:TRINITY_DN7376_c0_g1_i1.p1 TRINITY_DN7376_c0_g1~~TRINITY_DN7376_c0_g1_i1.p1  ORF type:complete len:282 (+),score=35.48 TRINITY_DN7376_c0_g1_i1:121-966(+)